MKHKTKIANSNRDGAMLPMMAVVIIFLFVAVTIGVDIARMHLTRSELRTATDASARAAVEALGRTQSTSESIKAAKEVAKRNKVASKPLKLRSEDIAVGEATENGDGTFSFSAGGSVLTSVRINGSRDANSADGPVGLLFGPIFGVTDFSPNMTSTATRTDRDIALVLDVSGSMNNEGRYDAMVDALDKFLEVLEKTPHDEYVSLSVYESTARKIQAMTTDLDLIRDAFDDEVPGGYTAIGLGMTEGLDSILNDPLSRPYALKSIVVMTDGNHNTGIEPADVAQQCINAGVSVITVTFKDGADITRMQEVAAIANGKHWHADSGSELEDAFKEIAKQLSAMLIE